MSAIVLMLLLFQSKEEGCSYETGGTGSPPGRIPRGSLLLPGPWKLAPAGSMTTTGSAAPCRPNTAPSPTGRMSCDPPPDLWRRWEPTPFDWLVAQEHFSWTRLVRCFHCASTLLIDGIHSVHSTLVSHEEEVQVRAAWRVGMNTKFLGTRVSKVLSLVCARTPTCWCFLSQLSLSSLILFLFYEIVHFLYIKVYFKLQPFMYLFKDDQLFRVSSLFLSSTQGVFSTFPSAAAQL